MTHNNHVRELVRMALINLGYCPKTEDPMQLCEGFEKATAEKVTGWEYVKFCDKGNDSKHLVMNGVVLYY